MNDFDKAARYTAKLNPPGFFAWLVPGIEQVLLFHGWLDARTVPFPGEPDRICDTVAGFDTVSGPESSWAIVVEFQSEPEPDMLERLHEYVARWRREKRPGPNRQGRFQVAAALLNLTGPIQPDTLEMLLPVPKDWGLRLKIVLRTLREESAADTLAGIARNQVARCILPWIPLMHGGAEPAIIDEWKRLAETEPSNRLRADYAGLALIFAELAGCRNEWYQALEEWNMRQSQQVLEWKREERVESVRDCLLHTLEVRFQTAVPADLAAAVQTVINLDQLNQLFDAALRAESLDAFRAAVQHRNGV
jgi:hypothetical protein